MISDRNDNQFNIHSVNYDKMISFSLNDLTKSDELWEKYIKSTIHIVNKKYKLNNGFDMLIGGNIPIGFGMSSSAALEVSIVSAILDKYCDKYDQYEILKICNVVEKEILGIQSGILDQYASIFSKNKKFLLIDFNSNTHEYFDSNIKNCSWVLVNSMISRDLVSSDYNIRVLECNEGLDLINKLKNEKTSFNKLSLDDIELVKKNKKLYCRLLHFYYENKRVRSMKKEISDGNKYNVGQLLLESHFSLSKRYEVSCREIDTIISMSKKHPGFYGGRIMGGGFGGCTINLVENNLKKDFISYIKNEFYKKFEYNIKVEEVFFSEGLDVLTDL